MRVGCFMKIYGEENNTFILNELGQRIKDIRISRSYTQQELAQMSGVSFSTIVRLERGDAVNTDNFLRILRVFNLLKNLDLLVPEQKQTPEEVYKNIPKRQRSSKRKSKNVQEWKWGDE